MKLLLRGRQSVRHLYSVWLQDTREAWLLCAQGQVDSCDLQQKKMAFLVRERLASYLLARVHTNYSKTDTQSTAAPAFAKTVSPMNTT